MGCYLSELTWQQAQEKLASAALVVIPLGGAAKQHGPHLPLGTDAYLAEWLAARLTAMDDIVVAPTVASSFYPAFVSYPGTISLTQPTASALLYETIAALAQFGPCRFYCLNTGLSTVRAIAPVAEQLAETGVLLHWTDVKTIAADVERALSEQPEGSHADELETSMMLVVAPQRVNMSAAVREIPAGQGPFSPVPRAGHRHSASGVYGDATLATHAKGTRILDAWLVGIGRDLETLRQRPLPDPHRA